MLAIPLAITLLTQTYSQNSIEYDLGCIYRRTYRYKHEQWKKNNPEKPVPPDAKIIVLTEEQERQLTLKELQKIKDDTRSGTFLAKQFKQALAHPSKLTPSGTIHAFADFCEKRNIEDGILSATIGETFPRMLEVFLSYRNTDHLAKLTNFLKQNTGSSYVEDLAPTYLLNDRFATSEDRQKATLEIEDWIKKESATRTVPPKSKNYPEYIRAMSLIYGEGRLISFGHPASQCLSDEAIKTIGYHPYAVRLAMAWHYKKQNWSRIIELRKKMKVPERIEGEFSSIERYYGGAVAALNRLNKGIEQAPPTARTGSISALRS